MHTKTFPRFKFILNLFLFKSLTIISQRSGIQTACRFMKENKKKIVVTIIANAATNVKNPL
jgi:hypothetical protein